MRKGIANDSTLQKAIANDCRLQKAIVKSDCKNWLQMIAKSDCKGLKKAIAKSNCKKWFQKLLGNETLKSAIDRFLAIAKELHIKEWLYIVSDRKLAVMDF